MRKGAVLPGAENLLRPDNDDYLSLGYVPLREQYDNSVSHALEYYIADNASFRAWQRRLPGCRGERTEGKKHAANARLFYNRSLGYKHYYSKEYGTFRPILPNGEFYAPFDPEAGRKNLNLIRAFMRGVHGTILSMFPTMGAQLMGGKKAFVDKLQRVFDEGLYDPCQ